MSNNTDPKAVSSSYATGGGGVRFEHEFAAAALASLLLGQPIEGLGDDVTPLTVALQQESYAAVDDVRIQGTSLGGERTMLVACRHKPTLAKSAAPTVKLFADYVQVMLDKQEAIESDVLRLGLAVAGPFGPADELATLTDVARLQPNRSSFEDAINAPRAYTTSVRKRLCHIDDLVIEALGILDQPVDEDLDPKELSWRLLRALFVLQLQLEGDVAPGKTAIVARLQVLTTNTQRAAELHVRLVEIASQTAIRAGSIDRAMLRRLLHSFGPLGPSPDFSSVAPQIAILEANLQQRTQHSLPTLLQSSGFKLDRSILRADLMQRITTAESPVILVRGEPDVGKSALTLEVIADLRTMGGTAITASLRDLPTNALELKPVFGLAPANLLAAAPSASINVLLLDGAEVVQESDTNAVGSLLDGALAVGMIIILVARDDAIGSVREVLKSRNILSPIDFPVPPLSDAEITTIVKSIPELARLSSNSRSAWLLRRLGLINLLLQTTQHGMSLPATLGSEADIFATVWSSLIRQNEMHIGRAGPDDREVAMISVARHLLTNVPNDTLGVALQSLRSDGVLLSRQRSSAWQTGDRFSSDVLRDFATARLLLREGLEGFTNSSAPRWAIRATRLYAQARLADAVSSGEEAILAAWSALRSDFDTLSSKQGIRWSELLWEAVLTAAWADRILAALTPQLLRTPALQAEAIRCVKLRFSTDGIAEPLIASPLVAWLMNEAHALDHSQLNSNIPAIELVSSWLQGIAFHESEGQDITGFQTLRAQVRNFLLGDRIYPNEKRHIECLGLLGSEANDQSIQVLQTMAMNYPDALEVVVENELAVALLSKYNMDLLLDLTEAYYIEQPSESFWYTEGIRNHSSAGGRIPMPAWYKGPFFRLLITDHVPSIKLVNRILERGVRRRIERLQEIKLYDQFNITDREESEEWDIEVDLLNSGLRHYIGDDHVWRWYRGSGVGPYPCMSALLALEMFLDKLVEAGLSISAIASWLVHESSTLAILGLGYGFLVRHIDKVTNELDDFLAMPEVWQFEFARLASEGGRHVQVADPLKLIGTEHRGWNPREVARRLVVTAFQSGNSVAIERLRGVGQRLIERAGGVNAPPGVQQWAACLDWESYAFQQKQDYLILTVNVPDRVVEAMAPEQVRLEKIGEMYRLQQRYRPLQDTPYRYMLPLPPDKTELTKDIAIAKTLQTELLDQPMEMVYMALAGVAAAVIKTETSESDSDNNRDWAVSLLIVSALEPSRYSFLDTQSIFPDGADRQAALALPQILLTADQFDPVTISQLERALKAGTTSSFNEVRYNAAEGLRCILEGPCKIINGQQCWHELAWQAIEAGARSVELGLFSTEGRRERQAISGNIIAELENRSADDLMLTDIIPATICMMDAARVNSCISDRAAHLRNALLKAFVKTACYWAEKGYAWKTGEHAAFAAAVLRWAIKENEDIIIELAQQLRTAPNALAHFLYDLAVVATYEEGFVSLLTTIWPRLMELGLAVVRENFSARSRQDTDSLIKNLIPTPKPSPYMDNTDEILKRAQMSWLPLTAITEHINEWIRYTSGPPWCIDSLVGFLQTQSVQNQASPGLEWVRRIVIKEDGTAGRNGFLLVEWLKQLRESDGLNRTTWPDYRTIIDGLVMSNVAGARDLQQRDE